MAIIYSKTEARKNFADIIAQVKYGKKIIAIKKEVLIVPYPEIEGDLLPITEINSESKSFSFLNEEPDIYNVSDLKKRYV